MDAKDILIYLSPSSQPANSYAAGNTNEQEQCRKIARAADKALKRCGFSVICGDSGTMYTRVAESNKRGSSLHVPIHSNGHNKKTAGTRLMCSKKDGEGYKACKAIYAVLAPLTPGTSENISAHPELYEIKNTKAPCAYIEVDFHDVASVAKWIIEHVEEIGEAIAKGICNYYGVTYKPAEAAEAATPAEKPKTIYRVQVGAFSVKRNAERLRDELKGRGYSAFITKD